MAAKDITLPTVAVGGIKLEDVESLIMEGGVNGVAVCSAIADADDITTETAKFVSLLNRLLPEEITKDLS